VSFKIIDKDATPTGKTNISNTNWQGRMTVKIISGLPRTASA